MPRGLASSLALITAVVFLAAGCQGSHGGTATGQSGKPAKLTITPADGAQQVDPSKGVTVVATGGKIRQIDVVDSAGDRADGRLSADGTRWTSTWTLHPSATYTVTATAAAPDGRTVTSRATFTTLKPARVLRTGAAPLDGETVGIGMPIAVFLSQPVTTTAGKTAVERAFEVQMSQPVEGAWHWVTDTQVWFRPRKFWPAGERVTFIAHVAGVRAGPGLYGIKDQTVHFTIGPAHISTVDTKTHEMTVTSDGKVVRTIPVSTGRPGDDTTSGIHIAQEKSATTVMDSSTTGCGPGCPGYYRITTHWNVRLTYSGEFVHAAPWSVGAQGRANVSHGCVNASPANAEWFYNFSRRGDVIIVTGTTRHLTLQNGINPWVLSWADWLKGSMTGPVNAPTSTPTPSSASPSGR